MRIGACTSRCIDRMLENIRVCAHAYMYVRAGCRRILLYWSRVVDHLPFSSPTLPHLSPLHTVPRPCTPCSPHLSSAPRPRVPLDVTHPKTFDSPTTQPPVTRLFLCVSAPTMIYELSQICIRVTYSIYVHTGIVFPCASIVPYSDNFEFFVSFLRNHKWVIFYVIFRRKKRKMICFYEIEKKLLDR